MTILSITFSLLFALFCGALAVAHSVQSGRMTLLDWTLLAVGGMYGLGWALVVSVTQSGGNPTWEKWINPFEALYPIHTISALILTLSIGFGWYLTAPLVRSRKRSQLYTRTSDAHPWARAFWLMLLVSVGMQWLYTMAYGGFLEYLNYSASIRSATFIINNPLSFLRPFGGLAMIATYGFFGLLLSGRRNLGTVLGLALSFAFSLYILYSWLGRMGFLLFLATFPLGAALARRRNPIKLIVLGVLVFVAILGGAYGVSVWLNIKAGADFPGFLARELSFPFASFFAQMDNGEHLFRVFFDFVVAPVYLLPSSWWTNWIEPVSQINTAVISGAPKGEAGVTGGIPVDLLTLGLMQAHILGIPIGGAMFGALLRALQSLIDRIPLPGLRGVFEAHVALEFAVFASFYAQPNLVVSRNFALILGAVMIFLSVKVKRLRIFPVSMTKQTVNLMKLH